MGRSVVGHGVSSSTTTSKTTAAFAVAVCCCRERSVGVHCQPSKKGIDFDFTLLSMGYCRLCEFLCSVVACPRRKNCVLEEVACTCRQRTARNERQTNGGKAKKKA